MLATFAIEIILAAWTLARYGATKFGKTTSAILILLATFQIAEYKICGGIGGMVWAKIGFVAITILPMANLYLISLIGRKIHLLKLGYLTAFVFSLFIVFSPKAISDAACGGNYVFFYAGNDSYWLYLIYYVLFLIVGIWESRNNMNIAKMNNDKNKADLFFWIIVGYLSFMIPASVIYFLYATTSASIASVMCGFAVIFAVILALKVVPEYNAIKQ